VRTFGPVVLLLISVASSFGTSAAVHGSSAPQPGILVLLGGGLVGLATVIRRYLSA